MNGVEFSRWTDDLSRRMPAVGQWLAANSATLLVWAEELFHDLDLSDCLDVNRELTAEGAEFKPWELDTLGAKVRSRVRNNLHQRETARRDRLLKREAGPVSRRGSMAETLAKMLRSSDRRERRAILDGELPSGPADEGPRYGCLECHDSGLVRCYDPDTVIAAYRHRLGQISEFRVRLVLAACFRCGGGDRYANGKHPIARKHDRLWHCNEYLREAQLAELSRIAEAYVPPSLAAARESEVPY